MHAVTNCPHYPLHLASAAWHAAWEYNKQKYMGSSDSEEGGGTILHVHDALVGKLHCQLVCKGFTRRASVRSVVASNKNIIERWEQFMHMHIHTCDPGVPKSQPLNMHASNTYVWQNELPMLGVLCISMAVQTGHNQLLRTFK